MSAAHLDVTWNTHDELVIHPVAVAWKTESEVIREIGAPRRPARCPECASIVYSRRHRLCGVCNAPLPDHLLFSFRDSQRVTQLIEIERTRHRRWLEQRGSKE